MLNKTENRGEVEGTNWEFDEYWQPWAQTMEIRVKRAKKRRTSEQSVGIWKTFTQKGGKEVGTSVGGGGVGERTARKSPKQDDET